MIELQLMNLSQVIIIQSWLSRQEKKINIKGFDSPVLVHMIPNEEVLKEFVEGGLTVINLQKIRYRLKQSMKFADVSALVDWFEDIVNQ